MHTTDFHLAPYFLGAYCTTEALRKRFKLQRANETWRLDSDRKCNDLLYVSIFCYVAKGVWLPCVC